MLAASVKVAASPVVKTAFSISPNSIPQTPVPSSHSADNTAPPAVEMIPPDSSWSTPVKPFQHPSSNSGVASLTPEMPPFPVEDSKILTRVHAFASAAKSDRYTSPAAISCVPNEHSPPQLSTIVAKDGKAIKLGWFAADELQPTNMMKQLLEMPSIDYPSKWSMHPELHDSVSRLLEKHNLSYTFNPMDSGDAYLLNEYNARISGRFECLNKRCAQKRKIIRKKGSHKWKSQSVGVLIRRYVGHKYNAKVYWQACEHCEQFIHPIFDDEDGHWYAECVTFAIKVWNAVKAEAPQHKILGDRGPHRYDLCSWCKAGRSRIIQH